MPPNWSGGFRHDLDVDEGGALRHVAGEAHVGKRLGHDQKGAARQAQNRNGIIAILDIGRLRIEDEAAPVGVADLHYRGDTVPSFYCAERHCCFPWSFPGRVACGKACEAIPYPQDCRSPWHDLRR
ncbi:hypothetical protein ABIE65_005335 [Constrictibacter sp. MBR-5]|jgi:hypothetical protein